MEQASLLQVVQEIDQHFQKSHLEPIPLIKQFLELTKGLEHAEVKDREDLLLAVLTQMIGVTKGETQA